MNINMTSAEETFAFQAEINQLLSLIINTFYSNKDIFLRELVSNCSDALDKLRYKSLNHEAVLDGELAIKIKADKATGTIVIEDNGIGMTRDELIKNLGTIAHSGTREFMEALQNGSALIGQFGVGFYSAFLVAEKVTVISKGYGSDETWVWESNAGGSFTVVPASQDAGLTIGTRIVLHVKEDLKDYLEEDRLREIVNKHSQFVGFPVYLFTQKEVERVVEKNADEEKEGDVEDEAEQEKETVKETVEEWEHLNKQQPIWMRKAEEVSHDEYAAFYKSLCNDWEDHLAVKHFSAEGQVEFKALLYVPPRAPFDLFTAGGNKKMNNIKLYVRRVLIMDESNDLLPEYLSFIKGVVDANDLPLNVSREMLQQNSVMKLIKKSLVKKTIDLIGSIAENKEKWGKFYEAFSKNIKLGIVEDAKNREKLIELLRFQSSKCSSEDVTGFKDYVTRMKEGQTEIYYVTGENLSAVKNMACIEKLKEQGHEVIFMVDPIDEYMVQHVHEYGGKRLVNCSKEGLSGDVDEEVTKDWADTCKKIASVLHGSVKEVKVSGRLVNRPCVIVSDQYGWSANMERIMKAQALKGGAEHSFMSANTRKTLEINPNSDVIKNLRTMLEKEPERVERTIELMFETALIDSGYSVDDPSRYCSKIYSLIGMGLNPIAESEEEPADIDTDAVLGTIEETGSSMEALD